MCYQCLSLLWFPTMSEPPRVQPHSPAPGTHLSLCVCAACCVQYMSLLVRVSVHVCGWVQMHMPITWKSLSVFPRATHLPCLIFETGLSADTKLINSAGASDQCISEMCLSGPLPALRFQAQPQSLLYQAFLNRSFLKLDGCFTMLLSSCANVNYVPVSRGSCLLFFWIFCFPSITQSLSGSSVAIISIEKGT